jgi:sec-independent protein translocase protein TatB
LEIFGIGLGEILIIAVAALVILGPERLPEAARTIGRTIAEVRKAVEPARSAWRDLSNEISNVSASTGNPWTVHPILARMTPEEREAYVAGGPMPAHVQEELKALEIVNTNGSNGVEHADYLELPELDYPMPHSEMPHHAAPGVQAPLEELSYPPPGDPSEK